MDEDQCQGRAGRGERDWRQGQQLLEGQGQDPAVSGSNIHAS